MSLKETWEYGLSFPKAYVDNNGRFIYQIPDQFGILLPSNILKAWEIYRGGLDPFIKDGWLCPESAKKFLKFHGKNKIIEYFFDEKPKIGERWAVVIIKFRDGRGERSYTITYSHLPKKDDDPKEIIKSPARIRRIHQCDKIAHRNLTSVPYEVVNQWFPDISYNQFMDRIKNAGNVEFDLIDEHEVGGLIYLANKSSHISDFGVLNEQNLEKINPEFRHINRGIYRLSELDRCCQELFQTTGLTDLLNKLKCIWIEETSTQK